MPWCPKCKTEYYEGIKVCSECGSELVESLDDVVTLSPIVEGDKAQMERLCKFLKYNKIDSATIEYQEQAEDYLVSCDEKEYNKAVLMAKVFFNQEEQNKGKASASAAAGSYADYVPDEEKVEDVDTASDADEMAHVVAQAAEETEAFDENGEPEEETDEYAQLPKKTRKTNQRAEEDEEEDYFDPHEAEKAETEAEEDESEGKAFEKQETPQVEKDAYETGISEQETVSEEAENASETEDTDLTENVDNFLFDGDVDLDMAEALNENNPDEAGVVYKNNAERAADNKSSAYTLLGVGGIGLVMDIIFMTGMIDLPLRNNSKYMVLGVMGVLFFLFLIMGIISYRNAAKYSKKALAEDDLTADIKKWCEENLTADNVEDGLFTTAEKDFSNEQKYFKRYEKMKKMIGENFLNLEPGYLDRFVDEYYTTVFPEK